MNIQEIYEACENSGFLTFATIDGKYPAARIAHFFAYDADGLYFHTMTTKPFCSQLLETRTLAVCGICEEEEEIPGINNQNLISGNYSIRITGDVKTISPDTLKKKAKQSTLFEPALEDMLQYKTMRTFVLYRGFGEIFNFDFENEDNTRRLRRHSFSFNYPEPPAHGLKIDTGKCSNCGECLEVCILGAIEKHDQNLTIIGNRCDACGDCSAVCPEAAITGF